MPSERPEAFSIRCYEIFFLNYFREFSTACLPARLPACLMRSVKRSGKLATATALLLWRKCFEFHGDETFSILNILQCMRYCLLIFL